MRRAPSRKGSPGHCLLGLTSRNRRPLSPRGCSVWWVPPLPCRPACPHLPLGTLTRIQTTQRSLLPQTTSVFTQLCPQRGSRAAHSSPEADPHPGPFFLCSVNTRHGAPPCAGPRGPSFHAASARPRPQAPRRAARPPAPGLAHCLWAPEGTGAETGVVSLHLDVLPRSYRDDHVAALFSSNK